MDIEMITSERARAIVGGVAVKAVSTHGAVLALCRKLAALGCEGPWQASRDGVVCLRGASVRAAAALTVSEPDKGSIRFGKWEPYTGPRRPS